MEMFEDWLLCRQWGMLGETKESWVQGTDGTVRVYFSDGWRSGEWQLPSVIGV